MHLVGKDRQWLSVAKVIADQFSKDRSTKVGALIVSADGRLVSSGYNGFPREVDDQDEALHERPAKYMWTVHAEINAIANAAAGGVATFASTMYTTMPACSKCAPIIAQARIAEVVSYRFDDNIHSVGNAETRQKWVDESKAAMEIFRRAGVRVRFVG